MLNKILGTLAAKVITSIFGFFLIMITARELGAEVLGNTGLIILGITIVLLVNNFVGGAALVYLVPRVNGLKLLKPSYAWALISSITVTIFLDFFKLVPTEFSYHIFFLSLINSIASINSNVIIGKENIRAFNLFNIIQVFARFIGLVIFIYIFKQKDIYSVIYSLYFGYTLSMIYSFGLILKEIKSGNSEADNYNTGTILKETIKYGSFIQFSSILQLLNYRLSYYIINYFEGTKVLGIFMLGVQIAEGVWFIHKGITPVQYSKISNTKDENYIKDISLKFFKLSFILTLAILIPVLILPENVFSLVFGKDFTNVKNIIVFLSPGIVSVALSSIFVHYFSGTGKFNVHIYTAVIGLLINLSLCFILIRLAGINGAAIATSTAYIAMFVFQIIVFSRLTGVRNSDFLIKKEDWQYLKNQLKMFKK